MVGHAKMVAVAVVRGDRPHEGTMSHGRRNGAESSMCCTCACHAVMRTRRGEGMHCYSSRTVGTEQVVVSVSR